MLENNEELLQNAAENQATEMNDLSVEKKESLEQKKPQSEPIQLEAEQDETVENTEPLEITDSTSDENIGEVKIADAQEKTEVENELKEETETSIETPDTTKEVIANIEEKVAIKSETTHDAVELPEPDFSETMEINEIVSTIKSLIKEHPVQVIAKHIDELKKLFNVKFGSLLKEAKVAFLSEGGEPSEFHFENPIQKEYNDVLFEYKKLRQKYYKEIEKSNQNNLTEKLALIEELKDLIENGNPDSMFKIFRDIQTRWRQGGPVPRENYADTWRTYSFHVERFYDLLHLSNELRDLDFKHNLEAKLKLVQRVEDLAQSDDVKAAFEELQVVHRLWKEELGPVSREHREEVWKRFSEATKKIHDRRHEYFEIVKSEFEDNLKKKEAILVELEAINNVEKKSHNEWQKSLKKSDKLRKEFIAAGRVPRANDKEIWEKFRDVNKTFNIAKNSYYKDIKKDQQDNLDKKMKLVEKAESLRDSEDWDNSTDVMKHIQAEWKTIGHVPKQLSDKIWNRFKEACNHYFDRLHKAQDSKDEELMSVYISKKKYLEDLKTASEQEGFKPDINQLKTYINEWKELGNVPQKQRYIEGKFNKFLDPFFENLSSDKTQSLMIRYKNMIESWLEEGDTHRLNDEIMFVRKRLDVVTKEKQQMETNRLYFSNAEDSNPMIQKILNQIEKLSLEIDVWESKLQYLRGIEY